MEKAKTKIVTLWLMVMAGFAFHIITDVMPIFWDANVATDASGEVPQGLVFFMMAISYLLPCAGIFCTLWSDKRAWLKVNAVLAVIAALFNLAHTAELLAGFSAAQLAILLTLDIIGIVLAVESIRAVRK